jgi:hypothetical protein
MLIKPNTQEKVKQAIDNGKIIDLFYLEEAKGAAKRIKSAQLRLAKKIELLKNEDGSIAKEDAWKEIDICIKLKKKPSTLEEADGYVRENMGFYRTGGLIIYTNKEKLGREIFYSERGIEYFFKVPYGFEDIGGNQALVLFFDFFMDGTPYFQRIETTFKGRPINEIVINRADVLANAGILFVAQMPQSSGYYLVDKATFIPKGNPVNRSNSSSRWFQRGYEQHIGFITREKYGNTQSVGVYTWSSSHLRMLITTEKFQSP